MLILREKTVFVNGVSAKLFSFDGKLWFSKARDLKQFRQRQAEVKASVKLNFAGPRTLDYEILTPYSSFGFDR